MIKQFIISGFIHPASFLRELIKKEHIFGATITWKANKNHIELWQIEFVAIFKHSEQVQSIANPNFQMLYSSLKLIEKYGLGFLSH